MPRWDIHFDTIVDIADREIIEMVAESNAMARVIRDIPIPPSTQERLDRLNIIRAVRGTTAIEGTEFSEEEVAEVMNAPEGQPVFGGTRDREEQEVRNAAALMDYVAVLSFESPDDQLSEDRIKEFHEILTKNIRYERNEPGHYRSHPVSAGTYTAPETNNEVRKLMEDFIRWFNEGLPMSWHPIVRAIVAHFYVISIHPFGDGNGRTSRAIESYLLFKAGVNARAFYSLSNYYYQKRAEYIEVLDHVRFQSDPDLTPFVRFALRGLVHELQFVHREVIDAVRLFAFKDFARETIADEGKLSSRVGERLMMFIIGLGNGPVLLKDIRSGRHPLAALYDDVTPKTLSRDVNYLRDLNLIHVEKDRITPCLGAMDRFVARALSTHYWNRNTTYGTKKT